MYLDGKRVLLAGATGLAGRSILRHLLAHCPQTRIRAVFHEKTRDALRDRRLEYVRADLCQLRDCRRAVKGCDSVFMAAAQTGGAQAAVSKPWRQVTDNAVMNAHIFQACHDAGVRRVVCVGSATLYQPLEGSVREEDLKLDCDPYSAYFGIGWVTRFVEKLCWFWREKTGLEVVLARCA
ncbi:MAG: NAD(P)-dependent oxidoreductase, partial [Candidatus Omnitrophica bacterium]|nr:NAD(P)-dependent oxidoreductase [Candidatus Omnitrophota bacterium]